MPHHPQLSGKKILLTGATGAIARPVARYLAKENEVWGAARFTDPALRTELDEAGVHTHAIDLETGELGDLPNDFTHVVHYAYTRRPSGEFHSAIQVNAIGVGHVLKHCQNAEAALLVSAATLYSVHDDPYHAFHEDDDIGFAKAPWGPSSPVSKVTLEAVARFAAEAFDLPTTIVRPAVPYGCDVDMTTTVIDSVLKDEPVFTLNDPQPLSLIHIDDMCEQIAPLLAAATVPATIVNWASEEVVSVQDIAAQVGAIAGKTPQFQLTPVPGVALGSVVDTRRIRPLVGPCDRKFVPEFERICRDRIVAAAAPSDP